MAGLPSDFMGDMPRHRHTPEEVDLPMRAIKRDAARAADKADADHKALPAAHHAKYTDAEALAAGIDDATSDPLQDGSAADGTEESLARKDHVHPFHHAEAHTAASHSDQGATGAELETLTDGSDADPLHTHASLGGVTDHGALTGLGDDDHSIYLLLAGRSGGQTMIGGIDASDVLLLAGTSHATKGLVEISNSTLKTNLGNLTNLYKVDFDGTVLTDSLTEGMLFHVGINHTTATGNKRFAMLRMDPDSMIINKAGVTALTITTLELREPNITLTAGAITDASTFHILGAPTEGTNNYAAVFNAGLVRVDGDGTDVFELPVDATDPTSGGGAATGRIPVKIGGSTVYLPYY